MNSYNKPMDTFLKVHTIFQTSVHTCVHLSIPNFARQFSVAKGLYRLDGQYSILHHNHPSIITISCANLPGLQRKLSVCKQRGREERWLCTAVADHKLRLQSMPVQGGVLFYHCPFPFLSPQVSVPTVISQCAYNH